MRAAITLVFAGWWYGECLAEIFLWQAQQACVLAPASIEALDYKCRGLAELDDLGVVDREAKGASELQAVEFVLDAVRQVNAVGQCANLSLDNMGRRGRAVWFHPFSTVPKQGGLFLRACDGDPEIILSIEA
jgi:hypothetical protein